MKRIFVLMAIAAIPFQILSADDNIDSLRAEIASLREEIAFLKQSNVLYGKKYVACGDSFTATGWRSKDAVENGIEVYDKDWKMYKTYPYWIAKRNSMALVNLGRGGMTMADYDGNEKGNTFSLERYLNIPEDADYITLKFGINDEHKKVVIGSVSDKTPDTFCGAYNFVLEHILKTHPYAKIGIIVTNGLGKNEYAEATIKVARRWGIPYLDLVNGNVSLLIRAKRDGVHPEELNRKKEIFRIDEKNHHPNLKGQIYESTIIENFLRSL